MALRFQIYVGFSDAFGEPTLLFGDVAGGVFPPAGGVPAFEEDVLPSLDRVVEEDAFESITATGATEKAEQGMMDVTSVDTKKMNECVVKDRLGTKAK